MLKNNILFKKQKVDLKLWDEFEKEKDQLIKKVAGIPKQSKSNSEIPQGEWMKKVTAVLRISEIAEDYGITECPFCHYNLYFDDARGWFCCANEKWNKRKCFAGNIVDLIKFWGDDDGR